MRRTIVAASLLSIASAAHAQDAAPDLSRDTVTVGVGVGTVPRYEGSNQSTITPFAAVRGQVSGVSFITQGTALYVDVIPRSAPTGGKFVLGPVAKVGLNRNSLSRVRDAQIRALGKLGAAVELGGHFGYAQTGVITSDYDSLSFDVAVLYDVAGVHSSVVVIPSISYGTPLSRKAFVGVSVSADYVGARGAQTYFGVTPAQSLASGLRAYAPGEGFKDVNFGAIGNVSLTGDLLHGLSLFGVANYTRLVGEIGRSPVVKDRGQFYGAVGLAYTF